MRATTEVLNTLYVQTQGAYLHLDHETIAVEIEGNRVLQVPLHQLQSVVIFGNVLISPFLIQACAESGRSVVWLDRNGRFVGRLTGPTTGNVLLRQAQYAVLQDEANRAAIARAVVAGKIRNTRTVLLRSARDSDNPTDSGQLRQAAQALSAVLHSVRETATTEEVRGLEGYAAKTYFAVFPSMIRAHRAEFAFTTRNRRPPRDAINALLSFLYTLVLQDCISACESVGLDPQVGYLHALRPGRPSCALDLVEEFRAPWADRLAVTLINRREIQPGDFEVRPGGSVLMMPDARKAVVAAYQRRKQEEIVHPVLAQRMPQGLVPQVQGRLLARYLRGDAPAYLPYLAR